MTTGRDHRVEKDSMGEVRVPSEAKWRAQTQRAVENFPISGQPIERELIAALALIKGASAQVRAQRGLLDPAKADAIAAAAAEVARGDWDAEFPIDVFQTGSGTSSNMNANEVLARLASERLGGEVQIHPNDDVNDPLSSNDQFPSAIHIAATKAVIADLIPALHHLAGSLSSEGGRVRRGREVRSHAPDGRDAGHARSGVRRLRGSGPLRRRTARGGTAPASPNCRWAAPPSAPASTRPSGFAARRHSYPRRRDRTAAHRGAQPLRGARRP